MALFAARMICACLAPCVLLLCVVAFAARPAAMEGMTARKGVHLVLPKPETQAEQDEASIQKAVSAEAGRQRLGNG